MNVRAARAAIVSLLSSALAVLLLGALAGCGGRPGTPEELFERVALHNERGDTAGIWDLLVEESRREFVDRIDDMRTLLAKNPGSRNLARQFNCTFEEFMTLPHDQIYVRENQGREQALVGAKITDKQPDPKRPSDVVLFIESPYGLVFNLRARQVEGGWGLVQIQMRPK